MSAFTDDSTAAAFERVCDQHSTVIPAESYTRLSSADAKRREVARLQRENALLRADARRTASEHKTSARQRRADELCAVTLHTIAEGLIALDAEGRLTCMNGAAERMLGWTEEELLGHPVEDLIHRRRPDGAEPPARRRPAARASSASTSRCARARTRSCAATGASCPSCALPRPRPAAASSSPSLT